MTIMDVCAGCSIERPARRLCRWVLPALVASTVVARTARADDVIEDPDLAGVPHEAPVAPQPANAPHETAWRTTIHSRWGVDTDWTRPSQDIVEGTTIASLEAEQRRSDSLLLSAGLRMRHGFGVHQSGAAHYELDVAPLSLFADVTPGAGYHVRAGYQQITLGRFDLFSATNFLATYDLRSGPVTMSEAAPIATPAIRFDFDKFRGFTLQAFYLPFFVPDLIALYGTDYSLWSPLDRVSNTNPTRQVLERAFTRSGLTTLGTNALQALAPPPDFRSPQGGIRATLYGSAGELSATVGTALEPLPTLAVSPAFASYLGDVSTEIMNAAAAMRPAMIPAPSDAALDRPIRVEHNRYGIASVDGAFDVGPVQVGVEAAYMLDRTLLGTAPANPATAMGVPVGVAERVNVAQFGLRAEYVKGQEWAAVVESFFAMALRNPAPPAVSWFGMDGRYAYGVAAGVHYTPEKSRLRFELGGAALAVATYLIMPRVEWEALNTFFLELGAVFIQGRAPNIFARNISMGGLYDDSDQVFVGVRWSP